MLLGAYSRSYWNLLETTGRYFLPDIKGRLLLKHTATGLLHCKSGNATTVTESNISLFIE